MATDGQADCSCCAGTFPEDGVVRLGARPDIAVCENCADGLATRRQGLVRAVPVLPTGDVTASVRFWSAAGFAVTHFGSDFASARRDRVELHLVEPTPEERDRGLAYLHVRGVDGLHAAWDAADLPVTDVRDEPWEMREFIVVDPGGNRVRVGQNL